MKNLSLRQKIGQLIVVRASGHLFDHQIRYPVWEPIAKTLEYWLSQLNIGGVILLGGNWAEVALRTQFLQQWAQTPLLIAADIEEGVGQRFTGATWFPPPMALSAIVDREQAKNYAKQLGASTAQEALAMGINWLLAPVVDVNNNPDNPVINVRAFGETPPVVSELTRAFIEGTKAYPVLTSAKHFPGHGDTATDSHLNLPVIPHDRQRLEAVELPPFQEAIAAGVDTVMTAHLSIPQWDDQYPATLSKTILTEKLRQDMAFKGLIVTDALVMAGVAKYAPPGEVALLALEAGADILLMPPDPEQTIEQVEKAVQSGRISEARINESVERIYQYKEKIKLFQQEQKQPQQRKEQIFDIGQMNQSIAQDTVKGILQQSMERGGKLPLSHESLKEKGLNLIVVQDLLNCDFIGNHTPAVTVPKQLGYQLELHQQSQLKYLQGETFSKPLLLQLFIRGNPFRGNAGLTHETEEWFKNLLKRNQLKALAVYGSPYILKRLQSLFTPELPWVFSYGQMPEAQQEVLKILLGHNSDNPLNQEAFI